MRLKELLRAHAGNLAILGIGLSVRLTYFVAYQKSPLAGTFFLDQAYYRTWGLRISAGDWAPQAVFEQAPLYAYLLGAAYRVVGVRDHVIIAAQLLLGLVTCQLVYMCGRRLFDNRTAFWAGLLAAVYGPLVFYECMLMKSFLSPLLTMTALYCGLRYGDAGSARWAAAAGAAVGVACLVRENHVLLLVPVICWIWTWSGRLQMSARRRCGHLLVAGGAAAFMILPTAITNFVVAREFVAVTSGAGEVFYMAHGPSATGRYRRPEFIVASPFREHEDFRIEARRRTGADLTRGQASRYWFREALRHIVEHPGSALLLTGWKAVNLLNDFEVPDSENYTVYRRFIPVLRLLPTFGWIVGLGIVGMALCWRAGDGTTLALGLIAAHVVSVLSIYNFGRFRLGMMPVWSLFAARGALWIAAHWHSGDRRNRVRARVGAAVALALTGAAFLPLSDYSMDHNSLTERLRSYSDHKEVVRRSSAALAQDRDDADARRRLALAYLQLGRIDEGREQSEAVIALRPRSADFHYEWGIGLQELGLQDEADHHLREAIRIRADFVDARMHLARSLAWRQQVAEAIDQLLAVLKTDPNHLPARRLMVFLLGETGRISDALEHLSHDAFATQEHERQRLLVWLLDSHWAAFSSAQLCKAAAILEDVAAAYARAGHVEDARHTLRDAINLARACGDARLLDRLGRALYATLRPSVSPE